MTPYVSPSDVRQVEVVDRLIRWLKGQDRLQVNRPGARGGLTIRSFIGSTASPWVPVTGQLTYGTVFQAIATEQAYDYETDINIWSRGAVSTTGVITENTTAVDLQSEGGFSLRLAPGESITLRNKNPNLLQFAASATPAATDVMVFFW